MDVLGLPRQGSGRNLWIGPILVVLGGLIGVSAWGEWASADVAGHRGSAVLLDAPLATILLWAAAAAIVAGGVATTLRVAGGARLAVVAGLGIAVAVGIFVCVAEVAASLVPHGALPLKANRYALGSGAGLGAWVALFAALGVVSVASPVARAWLVSSTTRLRRRGSATVAAVAVLAVAGAALFELRQEPWLEAATAGRSLDPDAASLPFVAPVTFAAVLAIAVAVGIVVSDRLGVGALLALGAGAVLTICAATVISLGELLPGLDIDVDIAPTGAVWITLVLGMVVVAAGAVLAPRGSVLSAGILELIGWIEPEDEPDPGPSYDPSSDWSQG